MVFSRSIYLSNYIIIAGSFIFYASFGIDNLTILFIPMLLDFLLGILIHHTKNRNAKKFYLTLGIGANLVVLAYFKYTFFIASNLLVFHDSEIIKKIANSNIILPVGISFITFQRIAYIVDIFRGKLIPSYNFVHYSTYATIFPHLISGPIVRYSKIKNQLEKRFINSITLFEGMKYFTIGLGIKILLADKIFNVEANITKNISLFGSVETYILIFLFSLRIYLDFSGYSLIAIGLAKFMGFNFPMNFNSPYRAISFQDFWRRWNITLSEWLRDYLYIPLGGNRNGNFNTYRNLIITFLLGGLWHGASWNFVLWGGLHGSYLAIERFLTFKKIRVPAPLWVKKAVVFLLVSLTWTTFIFKDFTQLKLIIKKVVYFNQGVIDTYFLKLLLISSPFIIVAIIWSFFVGENTIAKIKPGILMSILLIILFISTLTVALNSDSVPFIYFQF